MDPWPSVSPRKNPCLWPYSEGVLGSKSDGPTVKDGPDLESCKATRGIKLKLKSKGVRDFLVKLSTKTLETGKHGHKKKSLWGSNIHVTRLVIVNKYSYIITLKALKWNFILAQTNLKQVLNTPPYSNKNLFGIDFVQLLTFTGSNFKIQKKLK